MNRGVETLGRLTIRLAWCEVRLCQAGGSTMILLFMTGRLTRRSVVDRAGCLLMSGNEHAGCSDVRRRPPRGRLIRHTPSCEWAVVRLRSAMGSGLDAMPRSARAAVGSLPTTCGGPRPPERDRAGVVNREDDTGAADPAEAAALDDRSDRVGTRGHGDHGPAYARTWSRADGSRRRLPRFAASAARQIRENRLLSVTHTAALLRGV